MGAGLLVPLVSAAIWGITPLINAHVVRRFDVMPLIFMGNWMFALVATVWAFVARDLSACIHAVATAPWQTTAMIAAMAFLSTVAQYLVLGSMQAHPTALVVALSATSPLFTAVLGYLLLGETLNARAVAGLVAILVGIVAVSTSRS